MTEPKEEFAARGSIIVKAIKVEWEQGERTQPILFHVAGADGAAVEEVLTVLRIGEGFKEEQCSQLVLADFAGQLIRTGQAAIYASRERLHAHLEKIGERGDRVLFQFAEELLAEAGRAD